MNSAPFPTIWVASESTHPAVDGRTVRPVDYEFDRHGRTNRLRGGRGFLEAHPRLGARLCCGAVVAIGGRDEDHGTDESARTKGYKNNTRRPPQFAYQHDAYEVGQEPTSQ